MHIEAGGRPALTAVAVCPSLLARDLGSASVSSVVGEDGERKRVGVASEFLRTSALSDHLSESRRGEAAGRDNGRVQVHPFPWQ